MDWFTKFPTMDANSLRDLKKAIDEGFRAFTRAYGDGIESLFAPLQHFLIWSERFMTKTPWPIILILIALVAAEPHRGVSARDAECLMDHRVIMHEREYLTPRQP